MDSIQVLLIIPFLVSNIFSHTGAPHNHPLFAIHLFRSAHDISKIRVSTLLSFKLFRGCYIIQAFYSTGAFSFSSNLFNGVSFEWALTHMSFPRILPDSSYFPGAILKFLFEVWRKNELSSVSCFSPRPVEFFSLLVQPFYYHFGVSQQFTVVFLVVILRLWRPKKNFLSILLHSLQDSWF